MTSERRTYEPGYVDPQDLAAIERPWGLYVDGNAQHFTTAAKREEYAAWRRKIKEEVSNRREKTSS